MAHRCSICDRVDNSLLSNLPYGVYHGHFVQDPRNPDDSLCQECYDSIYEDVFEEEDEEESSDGF